MKADLTAVATEALLAQVQRKPWEKRVLTIGGWLAFLSIPVSWYFGFMLAKDFVCFLILVFFFTLLIVPATIYHCVTLLVNFRVRCELDELNRRFGRWNMDRYVRYYQPLCQPEEILCLFKGVGLPGGGRKFMCLAMKNTESVPIQCSGSRGDYFHDEQRPWEASEYHLRELTSEAEKQLLKLIEKTKGMGNIHFPPNVRDGYRAEAAILFGDRPKPLRITCNIYGLTAENKQDERAQLMLYFYNLNRD